ncbi:MAG: hypothetical protein IPP72_07195 [Chitinophagaceae bacterium]|nr:hypothetical protein [Chitinophagaceae bacterium]
MKKLLPAITLLFVLASCKTSKDYLAHSNEDKTLYDVVKQLNKKPTDELATKALSVVYAQLQRIHLDRIEAYKGYTELSRWDRVLTEYRTLQDMYNAVLNSANASALIAPVNYQKEMEYTRLTAADEYYATGMSYLEKDNREDARKAYAAFQKANGWIAGYKNSRAMIDTAKENSIVNVVIHPVQDNSFFFNSSWSNNSSGFNSDNIPQNLVRDLGGNYAGRYPARFYTDWQASRENIIRGWLVDLTLRDVDFPRPSVYNYTRNLSRNVEVGKDTSGKAIYQKVTATLHIQRQSFNAKAQMDMNITETASRKNILFDSFSDNYSWQEEVASYSGDSRALANSDWTLINNRYNMPTKEEVLSELYKGIYPQIKNRIGTAVDW